jgi:L-lactate permease
MFKHLASITAALLSLAASAFFFGAWYERYLRWDFNELGRHYDADTQTLYTTSGFVWVLPACACLLLAAWVLARAWRRSRAALQPPSGDARLR